MKNKKNNKGFSLVELIVVIAIMAVLVGVLAPQFLKYVENSRISTDMQNVQQIKAACEVASTDSSSGINFTVSITVSSGVATVNVTPTGKTSTKDSITLKSKGWSAQTYTLTGSTGAWAGPGTGNTSTNSNDATKDMKSVFGL